MASNKKKQSDIRNYMSKSNTTTTQSSVKDTSTNSKQPSNQKPKNPQQITPELSTKLLSKISIHRGSITDLRVDCIVNAANGGLWAGAGVCGAIFRASGYNSLSKECDSIIDKYGNIPTGESVITNGYKLHSKYIIHSVGPTSQNNNALTNCYQTALDLCILKNIKSIAFPCISTGIFGFSKDVAAPLAMNTIKRWLIMAKDIQYNDYIKLLREKEKQKLNNAMENKKKRKKWKWGSDSDDNDNGNGKNGKNEKKEENEKKEKEMNDKSSDEIKTNENENINKNENGNNETVFDRIDNIIFCCFDIGNWRLYENDISKVFPSQNKKYNYLWNDKLKKMKQNNNNSNGNNKNKNITKNEDENQMDLVDSQESGSENDD